MRILFTSVALPGHFYPLVPLAWACRSMGHDVLVATPERFVPAAAKSGLPVTSCGQAPDFIDLAADVAALRDVAARRGAHGRMFGRIAAHSLPGLSSLVASWRPDLVISERAEFAGRVAAAEHAIPTVELHWGAAQLSEYRAGATAALGLDAMPEPALVLNPWPPSLRLPYASSHTSMRYTPYNGDARVPGWVLAPRKRIRVCVTLGTVLPRLGSHDMVPALRQLARLDVDIVVAVDETIAAGWGRLPGAVRHVGRMPLAQVLTACDVVVHHGGQGTTLTAFQSGLPQLVLPEFDDQLDNADTVTAAGAGICLPRTDATPETIAKGCIELLDMVAYGQAAALLAAEIAGQPLPVQLVPTLTAL